LTVLAFLLAANTAAGQGKCDLLLIGNTSDDTLAFVDVGMLKEVCGG